MIARLATTLRYGLAAAGFAAALAVVPVAGQAQEADTAQPRGPLIPDADDGADPATPEMLQGSKGEILPPPTLDGDANDEAGDDDAAASGDEPAATTPPSRSDMAFGAFQRGYYLTARDRALPLAKLGDPAAQTLLGEIYASGLGVAADPDEAARWYKAAAEAGSAQGQFRYAMMLLTGANASQHTAEARDLMQSAAKAGLPLAEYNYAQMLIQASPSGGFEQALPYFERSAEAGVVDAQYAMSQLYAYGRAVPQSASIARSWLRAAAIHGHETAQMEYGIWLINGKGGKQEPRKGFLFLRTAAERANPIAINRIAHLYKDGIGVDRDVVTAAEWVVLAKRYDNSDPELDGFFQGLDAETKKTALERANRFRTG